MNIVFLARSLDYGGAERQLVALAGGLHAKGHRVTVLLFYPGGPLAAELLVRGVPVRDLGKGHRWDVLGFLWRLVRSVRAAAPDIVHAYLPVPNILAVLLWSCFPSAKVVWGVRASNMDLTRYDRLSRWTYRLEAKLAAKADLIIANSHAGVDVLRRRGIPLQRVQVVPNGIDTERFAPDAAARERQRGQWGVGPDVKLIGLVARLDPMKDHPTFLRATALLATQRDDVRFVCVGDGPADYRRQLLALAAELGVASLLSWRGAVADTPAVYNALDLVTLASYGEGFPNVVGEAMACGQPCVVTDVGDAARVVGDCGKVVPPRDPSALVAGWQAVLNLSDQDRAGLGAKARERIVKEYRCQHLIDTSEALLSRLLPSTSPTSSPA
ncbi:MAG TPA: glycosyltransferase [Gammaproteobacteria bacterium]|nr:glycosyltransferase [Gammaproteobacteria bacterium]